MAEDKKPTRKPQSRRVKKDVDFERFAKTFAPIIAKKTGGKLIGPQYTQAMLALYNAYNSNDDIGKGLSAAQATSAIAAQMGSKTAASMAPYIGYVTAAYNIYKTGEERGWDEAAVQAGGLAATYAFGAWAALPAMAVAKGYGTYKALGDKGIHPGEYTDKEVDAIFHPDLFGEQKFLDKAIPKEIGGHDFFKDYLSPMHIATRKLFGSSKNEHQVMRDRLRETLEKRGMFSKDEKGHHVLELADGSFFDVGRDGQSSFKGMDGKDIKYGYESDWSNPLTGQAVGMLKPLLTTLSGGREGGLHSLGAQFVNAAISNAKTVQDVQKNVRKIYEKSGLTKEVVELSLDKFNSEEKISDWEKLTSQNGLNSVFDDKYDFNKAAGAPVQEGHKAAFEAHVKKLSEKGIENPRDYALGKNITVEGQKVPNSTNFEEAMKQLAAKGDMGSTGMKPGTQVTTLIGQAPGMPNMNNTATWDGHTFVPNKPVANPQTFDWSQIAENAPNMGGITPMQNRPNAQGQMPWGGSPLPQGTGSFNVDPWMQVPKTEQERQERQKQWEAFKQKYPDGIIEFAENGMKPGTPTQGGYQPSQLPQMGAAGQKPTFIGQPMNGQPQQLGSFMQKIKELYNQGQ